MNWEYLYSSRLLKARRGKTLFSPMTFIAIFGIAFGLAATLVTLSVMGGFEKAYQAAILGFNAHIVLIQEGISEEPVKLDDVLRTFKAEGIKATTPFIFREGLGVMPSEVEGVVIKGVDPKTMRQVYPIHFKPVGQTDPVKKLEEPLGKIPPIILGQALLQKFFPDGIPQNPQIRVMVPKGKAQSLKDLSETFLVVGTFESGLNEFDSQFMLTSLPVMRSIFGADINGVEIILDDRNKAPALARRLEEALPPAFQAISWDELNEPLFSAMKMEKNIFFIMMVLIILIASFNVMGVIFMLIFSRKPDMAILKALGGEKKAIIRAFSFNGLILGGMGILTGEILAAGILLSIARFQWFKLDPEVYFISHLPVEWSVMMWGVITGIAFLICYAVSRLSAGTMVKQAMVVQTYR